MDKGAHYHRTDLQVHTPRDRQWFGNGATLEEERRVYAAELVATARQAGLSAVAITDHHDMALVDYVRAAAETEIDAEGRPLPVEQRLAVFPGMELTLGVPCQALLIFDANFPTDLFSLVLNALAITPAPATESRTAETVRLDRITSLESLYEELDRHAYLKGRYIVLPNVSERGNATLLRSGHAGHYRSMPCVGGYLDGTIDQLREGNTRILNGLDPQ